ncbi:hypothetical protein FIBSPDRAFT_344008 [Athelia psychrophila]|uniref:Uncharacterized protein n=1 Tax=Athelia psychrophila TaxID=1759441 RepID=A0A167W5B9_9AGAM|nr:hypothetical protein FIBSPDRAFT_344008 [Fibularhizoctonia sp. CBS 109695]
MEPLFTPVLLARGRYRAPRDRREHTPPLPRRFVIPADLILYQQVLRLRLLSITLRSKRDQRLHRLAYLPALNAPGAPAPFPPLREGFVLYPCAQPGRGVPASVLGVEVVFWETSVKGVASEKEEAGPAKMRRAMVILLCAISAYIPASAEDSFSLHPHAFRYVCRI